MNELRCLLLEQIEEGKVNVIDDIPSIEQIEKVVPKLKNKAPDRDGVMGEHFKNVKNRIVPIIHEIFTEIYTKRLPPDSFKLGVVTPVLKKGKQKPTLITTGA